MARHILVIDATLGQIDLVVDCEAMVDPTVESHCNDSALSRDETMFGFPLTALGVDPDHHIEGRYLVDTACLMAHTRCPEMTSGPFPKLECPTWSPDSKVIAGLANAFQQILILAATDFQPVQNCR